MAPKIK